MEPVQTRKLLGLIGLGVRGRGAIVGVQQVREAARRGKLQLAIAAPDASTNSLNKVLPLLRARGIPVLAGPSAIELGSAAGRETAAGGGIVEKRPGKGSRGPTPTPMPEGRKEQ